MIKKDVKDNSTDPNDLFKDYPYHEMFDDEAEAQRKAHKNLQIPEESLMWLVKDLAPSW